MLQFPVGQSASVFAGDIDQKASPDSNPRTGDKSKDILDFFSVLHGHDQGDEPDVSSTTTVLTDEADDIEQLEDMIIDPDSDEALPNSQFEDQSTQTEEPFTASSGLDTQEAPLESASSAVSQPSAQTGAEAKTQTEGATGLTTQAAASKRVNEQASVRQTSHASGNLAGSISSQQKPSPQHDVGSQGSAQVRDADQTESNQPAKELKAEKIALPGQTQAGRGQRDTPINRTAVEHVHRTASAETRVSKPTHQAVPPQQTEPSSAALQKPNEQTAPIKPVKTQHAPEMRDRSAQSDWTSERRQPEAATPTTVRKTPVSPLVPTNMQTPDKTEMFAHQILAQETDRVLEMRSVTEIQGVSRSGPDISIPRNEQLPRHIAQQLASAAQQNGGRPVELHLNPIELGKVKISINTTDTAVVVQISADRPETLDLMRRHVDLLAQDFRDIGYGEAQFSFAGHQSSGDGRSPETDGHAANDSSEPQSLTLERDQIEHRQTNYVIGDRVDIRL